MVRLPTDRVPTHPGEMLKAEFLVPMHLSQRDLADALDISYQRINEIVNARRGVSASTALRLARFLGTTPDLWLTLQLRWDLYHARQQEEQALASIRPYPHPA
jgi:antitoxin HigA-1